MDLRLGVFGYTMLSFERHGGVLGGICFTV